VPYSTVPYKRGRREYNINVYTANREPYSRTAIAMLKIQGAADK